jgi:hypothetical protein
MMKEPKKPRFPLFPVWLGLAICSVGGYLLISLSATSLGFPIDDAWIHQVFARNLFQRGEFSYNPGQPVAGSTSPLWTMLLAPGYAFDGFYSWWAYGLGILFLALTAREVFLITHWLGKNSGAAWGAALFTLFEWRMAWAGASGMETLLFTFGSLFLARFCLTWFFPPRRDFKDTGLVPFIFSARFFVLLGVVGGLLMLVRPEGVILLGLIALELGWQRRRNWKVLAQCWLLIGGGWLIVGLPYGLFNYALSGSVLPNTFGAKSGFYGDLSLEGLANYFANGLRELLLAGPVLLLLPGLLFCYRDIKRGSLDWRPLVWPPVLFVLYALRLPVTYHHGRYLMPLIPFIIIYGIIGTAGLVGWLRSQRLPVVARVVPLLLALGLGFGWINGGLSYQSDVKVINLMQVQVGRWLAENTPPEAVVATHDIGAITYFSHRKLVDTAGLVNPEFIPIVRDQPAILQKLGELKVDYFAIIPNWYDQLYPELDQKGLKIYQPSDPYLQQFGKENIMAVFKLK